MKKISILKDVSKISIITSLAIASVNAEAVPTAFNQRDTTVNIYGVAAKTDKTQDSHGGLGVIFDSEDVKVKLEGTADFLKFGTVLKFNPLDDANWYFKVGANYINQKMYAPDSSTERVNQYSGSLASGYMFMDDLYVEIGASLTELNGGMLGTAYEVVDESTKLAYIELAKRIETSIGTIDTTANAGEVYHDFGSDEFTYGLGVDYYPLDNVKLGYKYQNEKNNIESTYSAHYGYAFVEYTDKISTDTYQAIAGIKIAFDDLLDVSTYKMPTNIKPHLSELHRFEDITFGNNMSIQSTDGVKKTAAENAAGNTPNAFTFVDQTGLTGNALISSNTVTISGLGANQSATLSLPTNTGFSINGAAFQSYSGARTLVNGDTLQIQENALAGSGSIRNISVLFNGVPFDTWTLTTL
jgi:opacity protein-like surface antigen